LPISPGRGIEELWHSHPLENSSLTDGRTASWIQTRLYPRALSLNCVELRALDRLAANRSPDGLGLTKRGIYSITRNALAVRSPLS
jgi:hypothetical protein